MEWSECGQHRHAACATALKQSEQWANLQRRVERLEETCVKLWNRIEVRERDVQNLEVAYMQHILDCHPDYGEDGDG